MDPNPLGSKAQAGTTLRLDARAQPLEFIAIGHATLDKTTDGFRAGGSALYAARTAHALGLSSALVTATGVDLPPSAFAGLGGLVALGRQSTRFDNLYQDGRRSQTVLARAEEIPASLIERLQREQPIAPDAVTLYCPVADELSERVPLAALSPHGLCGVSPQGFMRRWDETGAVQNVPWRVDDFRLRTVDIVAFSDEDLDGDETWARELPIPTITITRGADGADILYERRAAHVRALVVDEVDPTGAGDVYMATLLIAMRAGRPPIEAARLACCAASLAVEGPFLGKLADAHALEERYRRYRIEVLGETSPDAEAFDRLDFESFCDAVESWFYRLKGRQGQFTPRDFRLVRHWYDAGWDLPSIERGIDNAFRERSAGRSRDSEEVNTLGYCEPFIREIVEGPTPRQRRR